MGSDIDRHGHVTDENIHQAMQKLHMPKWFSKETPGKFESRMAARAQMCAKHRDEKRDECRRLRRIMSATSLTLMKEMLRFVSKLDGVTIRIGKGG